MHLFWLMLLALIGLALFLILRVVLFAQIKRWYYLNFTALSKLPGPRSSSILQNLIGGADHGIVGTLAGLTATQCAKNIVRYKEKYGGVFFLQSLFGTPVVYVMDPSALQRVQVSRTYSYEKTTMARKLLGPLVGYEGVLLAEGKKHRRIRRAVSPSLHHESVALLSATLLEEADYLVERLKRENKKDPQKAMDFKTHVGIASFSAIIRAFFPASMISEDRQRRYQKSYLDIFDDVRSIYRDAILQMFFSFLPAEWFTTARSAKHKIRK